MIKINEAVVPAGFKEFTKSDYYGYAGAEPTTEGTEPFIKSVGDYDIIISRGSRTNMLSIYGEDLGNGMYYNTEGSVDFLARTAKKLDSIIKSAKSSDALTLALKTAGFKSF